jgi:hypothetical protein
MPREKEITTDKYGVNVTNAKDGFCKSSILHYSYE